MRERPILFNGPMVRAILDGRKTQTRRTMKPAPDPRIDWIRSDMTNVWRAGCKIGEVPELGSWQCPYGQPGDRLWVRETTEVDRHTSDSVELARYSADGYPVLYQKGTGKGYDGAIQYWWYSRDTCPSIHMPRRACRLVLEITDVRVERLQAISEEDCAAEGVTRDTEPCDHTRRSCADVGCLGPTYRSSFAELWTSTGGDWSANPWVWVISFRRIDDGGK